jgi:hypothetical protein
LYFLPQPCPFLTKNGNTKVIVSLGYGSLLASLFFLSIS